MKKVIKFAIVVLIAFSPSLSLLAANKFQSFTFSIGIRLSEIKYLVFRVSKSGNAIPRNASIVDSQLLIRNRKYRADLPGKLVLKKLFLEGVLAWITAQFSL